MTPVLRPGRIRTNTVSPGREFEKQRSVVVIAFGFVQHADDPLKRTSLASQATPVRECGVNTLHVRRRHHSERSPSRSRQCGHNRALRTFSACGQPQLLAYGLAGKLIEEGLRGGGEATWKSESVLPAAVPRCLRLSRYTTRSGERSTPPGRQRPF